MLRADIIGESLGRLTDCVPVHPVRTGPDDTAEPAGSKLQTAIEAILDFRLIAFKSAKLFLRLLIKIRIIKPLLIPSFRLRVHLCVPPSPAAFRLSPLPASSFLFMQPAVRRTAALLFHRASAVPDLMSPQSSALPDDPQRSPLRFRPSRRRCLPSGPEEFPRRRGSCLLRQGKADGGRMCRPHGKFPSRL